MSMQEQTDPTPALTEAGLLEMIRTRKASPAWFPIGVLPWQGEDHAVFDACLDWCSANDIDVIRDLDRMAVILGDRRPS